jgi:hypothetical protein
MAGSKFSAEFRRRVNDRVDVSSDPLLRGSRGIDDVCERGLADHEQVDITRTTQLAARGGAEDERDLDLSGEEDERLVEQLHDPEGLDHEPLQLGKDRGGAVCLEIDLTSTHGPQQQVAAGEQLELALDRTWCTASAAQDLSRVERFVGVA